MAAVLTAGSVFAGYRIERVLGAGGMGTVYLGRNPDLPRFEAIKVLSSELSRDAEFRARFIREADVAAGLDHPNAVSIFGRGEFEGQLWIAMQFVDGTDADGALQDGAMTPVRAVHIVTEVAKALDYAHSHQVVHRDVKPGNFLLSGPVGPDERVLLGDFGIARAIDDAKLTATGSFMATVSYAAPEVLAGQPFDGRADLYSLGCTLFRLLSGEPPFTSANGLPAVVTAHLTAPPPRVTDRVPELSMRMDQVIAKAMAKDPAQRFDSARKFAAAAAQALDDTTVALRPVSAAAVAPYEPPPPQQGGSTRPWSHSPGPPAPAPWSPLPPPVPAGPMPPGPKRRGRWIAAVAAAALVAAAAVVGGTFLLRSPRSPAAVATSTSKAPPTVAASAMSSLLLTPQQTADIMGAPRMVVQQTLGTLADDSGAEAIFGKDADCVGAMFPAQHGAYAKTAWNAARRQDLFDGNEPTMYAIYQAVIGFRSAESAQKALEDQISVWTACSGRTVTVNLAPGQAPRRTTFSPLNNANGVVTMLEVHENSVSGGCQRAMTTRKNVVVDISACRADLVNQAVDILNAIAAKI